MPSALSTRRTPSGATFDDFTNRLQNALFDFSQRAANARAGRQGVSAAAELLTNRAYIHAFVFRSHAHAHLAFIQFLKKNGHDDTANGADVIDQAFVIFRQRAEATGSFQAQAKTRDFATSLETHGAKELTQKLDATPRIIFIGVAADLADIDAGGNELGCNFECASRRIRILEGTGIGGNSDEQVFGDRLVDRKLFGLEEFVKDL